MGKKRFADGFVQKVRDSANDNLLSIVTAHLGKPSRGAGGDQFWCCPFHDEKSPSFSVTTDKGDGNFYHCFGCGSHGGGIQFEMDIRGLPDAEFPSVVRELATRFSIPLDEVEASPEQIQREESKQTIVSANAAAAVLYSGNLAKHPNALAYVESRGISQESIKTFQIGFASRDVLEQLPRSIKQETLIDAGLRKVNTSDGSIYDAFQSRLMFPISNDKGDVIGFSGRIIVDNDKYAKYLNTSETLAFKKGHALFGFYQAKDEIRKTRSAVVVEGNLDVVMLHQSGEKRAVAGLGTAFTEHHLRKLLTNTDEVFFCFDADKAGTKASVKAAESFLGLMRDGQTAKFVSLPQGLDPDQYIRQHGLKAWQSELQRSDALSTFIANAVTDGLDLAIAEDRASALSRIEGYTAQIQSAPNFKLALADQLQRLVSLAAGTPTLKNDNLRPQTDTIPLAPARVYKAPSALVEVTPLATLASIFHGIRQKLLEIEQRTPMLRGSLYSVPVVGNPSSHPFAANIKGIGLTIIDQDLFATLSTTGHVNLVSNTDWYRVASPEKAIGERNPVLDKIATTEHSQNSVGFILYALSRYEESVVGKRSLAPIIQRDLVSRQNARLPSVMRLYTSLPSLDRPLLLTGSIDDYGQVKYTSTLSSINSIGLDHRQALETAGAALIGKNGEKFLFTHSAVDPINHQQILLTRDETTKIVTSLANNPAYQAAQRAVTDLGYEA